MKRMNRGPASPRPDGAWGWPSVGAGTTQAGPYDPGGVLLVFLNLAFLIRAQHDRLLGRVQIQTDHVTDFGLQFRVGGELERLPAARA
jgi:hypothetical protein